MTERMEGMSVDIVVSAYGGALVSGRSFCWNDWSGAERGLMMYVFFCHGR